MRSEDWQRASALFEQALELAPAARHAWLVAECADDEALRDTVERWLIADASSTGFLDHPLPGDGPAGSEGAAEEASDIAGTLFGPYRALRPIGAGGMGEVWLAARADGEFEQHVAIKRLLYPTPELVRRFRHERRVLAGLKHPHIAQLHDGGVGADGAPYFVMEYVEGEPITRYCEEHRCGLQTRIALVLQVCDAVQYAHRSLIVHRDLKPSNVLVDAAGQVKLLDFGIAKVLESTDGTDDATATMIQRLTPDYAAPEQIRGEAITTATDVYALGVLLFELFTGAKPYRFGRDRGDLERAIESHVQQAPSVVAARSEGVARAWARRLRGDLDRIVAKAMAKESERRYASAEALGDDLRRFVAGRPVVAQGDDAVYRMRKFVRRNRAGVAAVVAIALALIAATAISLHLAHLAQRQAQRADAERTFVLSILDANDPNDTQGKGETLTARQILDRAAERIDKDLANQPEAQAQLKDEIGNLYWDYGQYTRALPLFEQAAQLAASADLPDTQRVGILLDLGVQQRMLRHLDDASATFRSMLPLARSAAGADSDLDVQVRSEYAVTLAYAARFDEAEPLARQVLAVVEQHHAKDSGDYADALATLAFVIADDRKYAEAANLMQQQLLINEHLFPEVHSKVSTTCNDLGMALFGAGRLPEAEAYLRRAVSIHEKLLGKTHPHYGGSEANLARVLDREGRFEEAHALLDESIVIKRHALGEEADALDSSYRGLAVNELNRGDAAGAEASARHAIAIDLHVYGTHHHNTVESQIALGRVLIERGKFDEADSLLQAAVTTADAIYGKSNDASGYAQALQARRLARSGNIDAALPLFEQAVAMLRATAGDKHFETADALTWQGEAVLAHGDMQRAGETARQALNAARSAYPAGDALIADSVLLQAHVDIALGHPADAAPLFREALALRESGLKADDPRIVEIENALQSG